LEGFCSAIELHPPSPSHNAAPNLVEEVGFEPT